MHLACSHQHVQFGEIVKYTNFSQITYDEFTRFSVLQNMYENCYNEQLAKIRIDVKYSINAYDRYILPFCFGNVNSGDYHGDFVNFMFPQFPVSYRFPCCFRMCLPLFLRFPLMFLQFSRGVFPVSYFRFSVKWDPT